MASSPPISTRIFLLIAFLCTLRTCLAQADTTSTAASTPASSTAASIYPGTSAWAYYGCYNETTSINSTGGIRALTNGDSISADTMTVPTCLSYCQSNSYAYAGLEYTRECYCGKYLLSSSAKLPDSTCNLACMGNSSQICGGSLKLTLYQAKTSTKSASIKGVRDNPVGSILALGIAMGVLLCLA